MTRIAVLRTGSMGDHLVAVPIYRAIRESHPQARIALICNIPAAGNPKLVGPASFLPDGLFDDYLQYPVGTNVRAVLATWRVLTRLQPELLYYLMPQRSASQLRRDRLFFALAGVRSVGLSGAEPREPLPLPSGHVEHEADRLARLAGVVIDKSARGRTICLTDVERAGARSRLGDTGGRTVVACIGTKVTVNDWGLDNWRALVRMLSNVADIDRLVLVGAPDEHQYAAALCAEWPRRSANYCGQLTPRESAAVLANADLYIGHDSGPMHLAAAVDVPIVAIFSSRNPPGLWYPLSDRATVHYTMLHCRGCGRLTCTDLHQQCIRDITPPDVFASCVRALQRPT